MYNEKATEVKSAVTRGRGAYFAGIIVCIVLLYVFNNLLNLYMLVIPEGSNIFKAVMGTSYTQLSVPFLSKEFISCLWAINLALGLGMMGNFTLLFYRPRWFCYLLQASLIALGILPVYLVHKIFPFILNSPSAETLVKNGLVVLMVLLGAASLFMLVNSAVRFIRTIRSFEPL
jgi:hypothetical protein